MRHDSSTKGIRHHVDGKSMPESPNSATMSLSSSSCVNRARPYQLQFACRRTGKYVGNTKRKLAWRFGLWTPPLPLKNQQEQREEHTVQLVWSVRKGKTRLWWNGTEISHLFPSPGAGHSNSSPSLVEFSWQSSTGVTFQITAHAHPQPGVEQYDLMVDGQSFCAFPTLPQLMAWYREVATVVGLQTKPDERETSETCGLDNARQDSTIDEGVEVLQIPTAGTDEDFARQQRLRLKTAGLRTRSGNQDELRSELFSAALDVLHDEMAKAVPDTEEMMSRAIVNAFSEDHDSDSSHEDSLSLESEAPLDVTELEADLHREAIEWLKDNFKKRDMEDLRLEFMEKQIETVVLHIRQDRLSPQDATRIMTRVAAVLGLELSKSVPLDTIALSGLSPDCTTDDVISALDDFGEIVAAAVARHKDGFAICRFETESAVSRVSEAKSRDEIFVGGVQPEILELMSPPIPLDREESGGSTCVSPELTPEYLGSDDENGSNWKVPHFDDLSDSGVPSHRRASLHLCDLIQYELSASGTDSSPRSRDKSCTTASTMSTVDDDADSSPPHDATHSEDLRTDVWRLIR